MKTYYPRNINSSWLNLHFSIGPFNISLVQMLVVAVWIAISLAMRNGLVKNGSDKLIAAILTAPIALVFGVIAFFEISELPLIPFVAKLIQTYILDEPRKFQIMVHKDDPVHIHLKQMSKMEPDKQITESKTSIDLDKRANIEKQDIL
jgi:hypothetical protein